MSYKDACGNTVLRESGVALTRFLDHRDDRDWCPTGTDPYVDNLDLAVRLPALTDECPSACLFDSKRTLVVHGAFIGPAGCTTRLHSDSEDNLIFCAFGKKLFVLLPPEAHDMVEHTARSIPIGCNKTAETNAKYHPMFQRCAHLIREVVLGPGDLLVLPKGWMHWVRNLEFSFTVACWAKACPRPGELAMVSDLWVSHQGACV